MSKILIESPFDYITDRTGRTLINGKIYIGIPGQDPQNFPQNAYFDVDGTIAAAQPIRTNSAGFPCDASGNPQRIFTDGPYSLRISDQNDVQVLYAQDSTEGFFGVTASDLANQTNPVMGSGLVGYIYRNGDTGTTVHDKIARSWVDIKDFGAVGDGVTNDKAAFDAAAATGRSILLPAGSYNVPTGSYGGTRFYSFDGATCTNATVAIVDPLSNSFPVGAVAPFPCIESALPFGWLALNGQTLNRTVYPALWTFANNSGVIVDEVNKPTNQMAFGRGNGTTTFSLPDMRGGGGAAADAGRGLDATFIAGRLVTVTAASAAPGISVRSNIFGVYAIRAFATATNQGSIDIQALQTQLNALDNRSLKQTAAVTLSGASVDITGIPSGTKRITLSISALSTNGVSIPLVQLGSGTVENTGYLGGNSGIVGASTASTLYTVAFGLSTANAATFVFHGQVVLTLLNATTNTWTCGGSIGRTDAAATYLPYGSKALAGVLDRIRITTSGADLFDGGSVSILYEG